MVDENVLNRLEPDERAVRALLRLVGIVLQATLRAVEDEPASFPLFDGGAGAQLGQIAMAGARCQLYVTTLVEAMAGRLNKSTQIQVSIANWKVTRQRTRTDLNTLRQHTVNVNVSHQVCITAS